MPAPAASRSRLFRRTVLPFLIAWLVAIGSPLRADDSFIAGYATGILEREFSGMRASVRVTDGVIHLQAADLQGRERDKVVASLSRIAGVKEVRIEDSPPQAPSPGAPPPKADGSSTGVTGGKWQAFPEEQLFGPLLADPRCAHFSIGYQNFRHSRFPDLKNVGAVSLGENFNLVGYSTPGVGEFALGVEPALFAIFNMDAFSHDLVNADYRAALPLDYRNGPVSLRASILHQSSHLGDEFLLDTPTQRINYTYEAVELKASWQAGNFRFYGGGSRVLGHEPDSLQLWGAQQGVEWLSTAHFLSDSIAPVVAVDVQEHQETGWHASVSARVGIEFVNPEKARRRIQILLEYFRGYNPNGQFYRERVDYVGIGLHTHF